jgi:hypothetical protein
MSGFYIGELAITPIGIIALPGRKSNPYLDAVYDATQQGVCPVVQSSVREYISGVVWDSVSVFVRGSASDSVRDSVEESL